MVYWPINDMIIYIKLNSRHSVERKAGIFIKHRLRIKTL